MKILHITPSYKPAYIYGGTTQSIGLLCEAICEYNEQRAKCKEKGAKNKDITQVFTTTANGEEELNVESGIPEIVDGVPVTYFTRWTKDHSHFSSELLWHLREEIRRFKNLPSAVATANLILPEGQDVLPEKLIIHIHAWWNLVSIISCLVAKWYNVPVVLSPRGMLTSYTQTNRNSIAKKIIHKLIGKRLLRYCHIHATSNQEQKEILEIVKPKSISVIPNLVNVAGGRVLKAPNEADFFKLIFLSRIEEKKGLELLFESLALIEIPLMLTIAGSGEESYVRSLKQKAASLKLGDRINWVGQVSNEDKFNLIANHDLLVLTSYNENFANVIIESLSVGTAVLVSNKVGLADYVNNNELGWICSLTSESIQNNLLKAFEDSQKRQSIRNSAPSTIRKDFIDDALVKKYLDLYENVLNKNGE
ncbi:XrtY-associated glycosyltransferase XYAG1 [Pedobacter sp. Leaf250]|uniref:XrtY-associated glycosyltransferase XYAG1 n=1 Tax=Pedobacter sp. Leaf250 TaxID=2876559 RepID=UPI001E636801|nr:glycosyltransferase [Pedobacter sp. Leaf250]